MELRKATLVALIAVCVLFLSKSLATFFPEFFKQLGPARLTVTLSALSALTIVYFYYLFYRDYARADQPRLKKAALLAAIGAAGMTLLHIRGFLLVFDLYVVRFLVQTHLWDVVIPWGAAIISLVFLIVFLNEIPVGDKPRLRTALKLAAAGSAVGVVERSVILYNYLQYRQSPGSAGLPAGIQFVFFPLIVFAVGTVVYFFYVFYRDQRVCSVAPAPSAD